MATLLPCDVARSEHDPDLEAAAVANTAMHPVTGTFADPTLEAAFSVHLFGLAYPVHLLLMTLAFANAVRVALASPPELQALWGMIMLCAILGLVGRALLHRMHDSACAQRVGSWTWAVLMVVGHVAGVGGLTTAPAAACKLERKQLQAASLVAMAGGLINGSHGMSFVHKMALVGFVVLTKLLVATPAICQDIVFAYETVALILGAAVAQMTELYLRHSYAEKRRLDEDMDEHKQRLEVEKERLAEENRRVEGKLDEEKEDKRRLEERNEQLQAEKERMLYDLQRRGRPLDEDDNRSAIRRGLRAGPSQPYRLTDPSEAGAPTPSESPPPSLPPGAPSSTSSGDPLPPSDWRSQFGVVPFSWEEVARRWHAKNPGWGCSALAQTAPSTAATAQLAEEGAAVAHQSGCAPQRLATHGPHQPRIIALNRAGAGLGAELHQGTKRLRQTGSCSLAEAAASEGTQHIEEGPKDQRNQEPRGSRVTSFVPPKRPSPPTKAPAPPAKKAYTNPYLVFCREQRPLLPPSLNNKEREKRLSMHWKALSVAEKAVYRARLLQGDGALAPTPAPTNTLLSSA